MNNRIFIENSLKIIICITMKIIFQNIIVLKCNIFVKLLHCSLIMCYIIDNSHLVDTK